MIQGLQDKTSVLQMDTHFKLHPTHLKQMTQTQTHPLHTLMLIYIYELIDFEM